MKIREYTDSAKLRWANKEAGCRPKCIKKWGSIASLNNIPQGTIMTKTAEGLHFFVNEEKLALDLLEQIKNGGDFEKLAKILSQ